MGIFQMFIEAGLVTERNASRDTFGNVIFFVPSQIKFTAKSRRKLSAFKHFKMCFPVSDQIRLVYESQRTLVAFKHFKIIVQKKLIRHIIITCVVLTQSDRNME